MPHYATITAACMTGLATGHAAFADPLLRQCGGYLKDLSKSTQVLAGVERSFEIIDFDEATRSFGVIITPADGLSKETAQAIAAGSSDILCMHFDSQVGQSTPPVLKGNGWYVSSRCEGHWVRMEDGC